MNKKFMAMLLATVMVIGMLPMTAMAKAHECVMEELVSISATQHRFKCTCNSLIGVPMNHNDGNGDRICDGCGYEMYKAHECVMEKLVSISATQHQFMCTCNSLIGVAMNHNDADGDRFCDGCKYEMYEAVEGDHEHKYVAHSNNNGTHNTSCTCGLGENNIACVDADKNGECDACKYYLMPVELPTYAAASTAGLDNVPKTGCAFIEWLYALIFG